MFQMTIVIFGIVVIFILRFLFRPFKLWYQDDINKICQNFKVYIPLRRQCMKNQQTKLEALTLVLLLNEKHLFFTKYPN